MDGIYSSLKKLHVSAGVKRQGRQQVLVLGMMQGCGRTAGSTQLCGRETRALEI